MTDPFNGRLVVTSSPTDNTLAPAVDAVYAKAITTSLALGNKADAATVTTNLAAAQAALNARIDQTPYELETVAGAYPPRPATPQHVHFMDPAVQPTFDGQLTGGGGMVPDWDIWWTGGSGVATA